MERTEPRRRGGASRRRALRIAAGCLWLSLAAVSAAGPRAVSEVRPPKLEFSNSTLPNGLRLVLHEDHSTPIVNVQVWYHVGSKDDRPGRSGLSHLLERLMFTGSKNVQPGQHMTLVTGVGGQADAYTTEDVTVFWETVPSEFLPMALWLEADRMASLRIDKAALEGEREAAIEARRVRVENEPYGRLSEIVNGHAFTTHPYRYPTIGTVAGLEAASLDEVRAFYRTFYVPANVTVVIAGDVDPGRAVELATAYFGRIPGPSRAVPRDIPAEPAQTSPRRLVLEEGWPLPVVVVAHHVTFDGHPDSYPLQMASKILSDGQSARLYRKLVYETGIASSAAGVSQLTEHPNLFYAFAVVQPGHTPAEAERALAQELDRLRTEPVSERELTRAKRQFTRDFVLGRETVQQKASVLARAAVLHKGDVGSVDAEFDLFQRVSAADIQRVAQTLFAPHTRMVITVTPKPAREGAE
ncbi:MAG TPA: pitrilysin family protein [Vicinamibacterales bacterium]|nr:pitrilysin family protein [Vicinamibacterales bacterium]